jgi:hypothetical protein
MLIRGGEGRPYKARGTLYDMVKKREERW